MFEWQKCAPEEAGMDGKLLQALTHTLAGRRTKALFVVRRDRVVWEWYSKDHGPEKQHGTASLAKAIVGGASLMFALADGLMDADDLACKYVPQWRDDPVKSKITIRHLATHASGVEDAELSAADRKQAEAEGRTVSVDHMELSLIHI